MVCWLLTIFGTKEITMALAIDKTVEIISIDALQVHLRVGDEQVDVDRAVFEQYMTPNDPYEPIMRNVALSLVMGGLTLDNEIACRDLINKRTFKGLVV